ncbi:hypothetical protein LZ32DRAFT_287707 [Colletotrichum eremochloae]|nr:hypothetical protein LZ32DRAFT_287707 [Colletotrichum eremochloae]
MIYDPIGIVWRSFIKSRTFPLLRTYRPTSLSPQHPSSRRPNTRDILVHPVMGALDDSPYCMSHSRSRASHGLSALNSGAKHLYKLQLKASSLP